MQFSQIASLFMLFTLSPPTIAAAASVENAVICFNCSAQQAQVYATELATPQIECDNSHGDVFDPNMTQACYSQPRDVVVYDGFTQRSYGFRLSHTPQGAPRNSLELQATPQPVPSTVLPLLANAAAARIKLENHFDTLAQAVIQDPYWQQLSASYQADITPAKTNASTTASSCDQDPHANALRDALSTHLRTNLAHAATVIHSVRSKGILDSFLGKDNINHIRLDSMTFSLTSPYASVAGTFKMSTNSQYITRTYTANGDVNVESGFLPNPYGNPYVVFTLTESGPGISVAVNQEFTMISGYPLQSILSNKTTAVNNLVKLNACQFEVMRLYADIRPSSASGGAGLPVSPPGAPASGNGRCTRIWDVYTNGTWTGHFVRDC
jgi:hypothetical protein